MVLKIYTKNRDDFIYNFIPRAMISFFHLVYDYKKYNYIDEYLEKEYNIKIKSRDLIIYFLKNLEISKEKNYYLLKANKNINIENTNIKLAPIIRLIEYGNLDIKGIHIINKIFNYINANWKRLLLLYGVRG